MSGGASKIEDAPLTAKAGTATLGGAWSARLIKGLLIGVVLGRARGGRAREGDRDESELRARRGADFIAYAAALVTGALSGSSPASPSGPRAARIEAC